MKPAIVLGTHTMGLGVIRALGKQGVPVVALYYDKKRDMGYTSRYVSEKFYCPHPETDEQAFIDCLLDLPKRLHGSFLIPASDASLEATARHKETLEKEYVVGCTDWTVAKLFIEKKYTYQLAAESGVPAPRTIVPHSEEEAENYARQVLYPCLVKPCRSHNYFSVFERKMVKVDSLDELMAAYRQAEAASLEVLIQEYIPGGDECGVNYNSYFVDGKARVEFTAEKIRNAPPELGSPCVLRSKHLPEVIESGRAILKRMGFYGYSCSEFKRDPRDGVFKLMEVNGRHNLSTLLAVHCGLNFPWIHYRHLMYGEPPAPQAFREGVYWIDMERDLFYGLKNLAKHKGHIREYLRPYFSDKVYAVPDLRDLRPLVKRWLSI